MFKVDRQLKILINCKEKCEECNKYFIRLKFYNGKIYKTAELCTKYKRKSFCGRELKNLSLEYPNYTLDNFVITPTNKKLVKICEGFDIKQNIFIYGNTGVGKTHFCVGLAKKLLRRGIMVQFWNILEIFQKVRDLARDEETDTGFWEALKKAEYLFLDDFGAEKENEYIKERLLDLVDARIRKTRGICIISNLTLEDIKKTYGERIYSRISSFKQIEIKEYDRRVLTQNYEIK